MPLVSIIIPSYNGVDHLPACLESLQQVESGQTNIEILVIDNGSSDDTAKELQRHFPGVIVIRSEKNRGFAWAANEGARRAAGDYVAFLNNDMRVDRGWLLPLLGAVKTDPGIACAGSMLLNWDGTSVEYRGRRDDMLCLSHFATVQPSLESDYNLYVSGGAMLMLRAAFDELGGFDADYFLYGEDVDLGWRVWLRGYKCLLAPASRVYHKGSATSKHLAPEVVDEFIQFHGLCTVFKNLDSQSLNKVLPLLFYHLLDRSRWWTPGRYSVARAMRKFLTNVEPLLAKRQIIQKSRIPTDEALFGLVGHPFGFLLRHQPYQTVETEIKSQILAVDFDRADAATIRNAMSDWMSAAHFVYERRLTDELALESRKLDMVTRHIGWRVALALRRRWRSIFSS